MPWLLFLGSAAVIVVASLQLAKYGDVLALRTGLGGLFMGTLLMAAVTTLPEILVMVNAISMGVPDLTAGDLLGSCMFNVLILAILDLIHHKQRILRKAALKHALSGSLAVLMIAMVVFFIYADLPFVIRVGRVAVGAESLALMLTYVIGMRQIQRQSRSTLPLEAERPRDDELPGLWVSVLKFGLAAAVLVIATPWLVDATAEIAEITGLGATFIGATLLAIVTSVPELVTTISAAQIGADDMAIGNLFGSNIFNMALFGVADLLLLNSRFFGTINQSFLLIGMLALLMTILGWIGNLARIERRLGLIEIDALLLILVYFGGMALLYSRGLTP